MTSFDHRPYHDMVVNINTLQKLTVIATSVITSSSFFGRTNSRNQSLISKSTYKEECFLNDTY